MVAGANYDGVVREPAGIQRMQQLEDLRVDLLIQVGVEPCVAELPLAREHVAGAEGQQLTERRLDTWLRRQVIADVRGHIDRQILEVLVAVAASCERRAERQSAKAAARVLLNVVRIDEGDDQTERLVAVVGVDEIHRTLTEELIACSRLAGGRSAAVDVPAVVVDRAAAKIREAHRVAHVRRIPAVESVSVREVLRVGRTPVIPPRGRVIAERPRQVQLPLQLHVIPGRSQDGGEVGQATRQDRDPSLHRVCIVVAGDEVLHPVLRRIQSREERGAARRARGGVALRAAEMEPVGHQSPARGKIRLRPSLRPVHHLALLIGDDDQQIRLAAKVREPHDATRSVAARLASTRCIMSRATIGPAFWF
jgi:hypothetical protein